MENNKKKKETMRTQDGGGERKRRKGDVRKGNRINVLSNDEQVFVQCRRSKQEWRCERAAAAADD